MTAPLVPTMRDRVPLKNDFASPRGSPRMFKKLLLLIFLLGLLGAIAGGVVAVWGYNYYSRDLPRFEGASQYQPVAVTRILSADGTLVGEYYQERRYIASLDEIPLFVREAFLAAEDASFYSHPGIDIVSILRALVKNIQDGSAKQGGSTITQQVVKNILLTKEKSIERKVKEAILAFRIEKKLSKDQILEIYLNQIFFGSTAYGIKSAARVYFHKELDELTLGEAAMLAGLPKAPSRFSPLKSLKRARKRQRYVLDQMVRANFVTSEAAEKAYEQELKVFPSVSSSVARAPYYVSEVRRIFESDPRWREYNIENDGLTIHTALDLNAYRMGRRAVQKGLKEVDKRRGWRGPLEYIPGSDPKVFAEHHKSAEVESLVPGEVYPALVESVSRANGVARVNLGKVSGDVNLKSATWARRKIDADDRVTGVAPDRVVRAGDVIEVSVDENASSEKNAKQKETALGEVEGLILDQTPLLESALVLVDPHSGKVETIIGGYDYDRSEFNRATQGHRQPGSAFKPIVYLSAIDSNTYTPASIVYDEPRTFKVGDEYWTPANYDHNFLGPITLRTALEKSRNLVSADIISLVGVQTVIKYARELGIESPLGQNLSLSLGSSEVTPLEITRAYGVFAAKGVLFNSIFITKVLDRHGDVIYDYQDEQLASAKRVISEQSAFIMANMMKGVVQHGTGYRVKELGRPAAGKTGTSNDLMDGWFVGYTPNWACGVWTGFDQKKKIGIKETGGRVSAPTWLYFMSAFLDYEEKRQYKELEVEAKSEAERLGIEYVPPEPLEPLDFTVPDGVEPYWIDKQSGTRTEPGTPGAFLEYFKEGTEPGAQKVREATADYWNSPEL